MTCTHKNAHKAGDTKTRIPSDTHTHTDGLRAQKSNGIVMYFYAPETMFTGKEKSIPGVSFVKMGS